MRNKLGDFANGVILGVTFVLLLIFLLYFTSAVLEASILPSNDPYPGPQGYIPAVFGYPGPGPKNTPVSPTQTPIRPTSTPQRPPTPTFCSTCESCSTAECYQRCINECGCRIEDPQVWICPPVQVIFQKESTCDT